MSKPNETALVMVDRANSHLSDALAESLEIHTGLRVKSISGVRDPLTGTIQKYLALDAPISDIVRLVGDTARVGVDAVGVGCTYRSINTIKADIAARIYQTNGDGVVWAVFDSGVDSDHPHFALHGNLNLAAPFRHVDLLAEESVGGALTDEYGHGTFMAGIIAGENRNATVAERLLTDSGTQSERFVLSEIPLISGVAPKCKILSVKLLDQNGQGKVSTVIEGLSRIQEMNDGGRQLRVHGINLGLGFDYDASRFACGRTPLCMEVDRIVRSGVVVVAPAGNLGFEPNSSQASGMHGVEVSIQDPGNAELAITVGSTHRELPDLYGISYFSSKGPTLDGRAKPDLVAPGERIVSCCTGTSMKELIDDGKPGVHYYETSGTSLATAHVSGACAALLSARKELKGQPELLKKLLLETAVDLRRSRFFQGRGLIDVFQAVKTDVRSAPAQDEHFGSPVADRRASSSAPQPTKTKSNLGAKAQLRVMYSYAHVDEQYKADLHTYLGGMRNQGLINVWQDRLILPGSEFDKDIARALDESDIIILLVSASFLDSKYCWGVEMTHAVQRHAEGTARVVPVILKPTPSWQETPFGKLTALPKDGKPITTWENRDIAWTEVAEELRRLVVSMQTA